jgi:RecA/RadA recombinase
MKNPTHTPEGLAACIGFLTQKGLYRDFNNEIELSAISSGCPTLDYVTDMKGFPRGRVVEISGPESSGKCVSLDDTYVSVPNEGLLTMSELLKGVTWDQENGITKPDQAKPLGKQLHAASPDPVDATHAYYAGVTQTYIINSEDGHGLRGTPTHRVLIIPPNGIARWTELVNVRPQDLMVISYGHRAARTEPLPVLTYGQTQLSLTGETQDKQQFAFLLGALAGCEERCGEICLATTSNRIKSQIKLWAEKSFGEGSNPFGDIGSFEKFSGIANLEKGTWAQIAKQCLEDFPKLIRRAPLNAQIAWAAALTVAKGEWTIDDLEIELYSELVAKTLQLVLENLGIRVTHYPTLDTFGNPRWKVVIRGRVDQQTAEEVLWGSELPIPNSWKKRYVRETDEYNHPHLQTTLRLAKEVLVKQPVLATPDGHSIETYHDTIDVEDTSKENLQLVANLLRPYAKSSRTSRILETLVLMSQPHTGLDRVTSTESAGPIPTGDVSVPIGHYYATNGIISHNSTLSMHLCKQEMTKNPEAVCVYLDYERSSAKKYVSKMGLLNFGPRFILVDPDTFEQAEETMTVLLKNGVFPSIFVCDSVPAMVPAAMFDKDPEDNPQIALQARKFADLLAKWVKTAADYGTLIILINQVRAYISTSMYDKGKAIPGVAGSEKETTPGGNAIRFYCSMRLDLRPSRIIKARVHNPMTAENEEIPVANVVKATAKKNKVGSPFKTGLFHIQFGEGIDTVRTMLELGVLKGLIDKGAGTGSYSMTLKDGFTEISARGEENFVKLLKSGPNAKAAQEYLADALDWNRAEEVTANILGLVEENTETGESVSRDSVDDSSSLGGKIAMAKTLTSVVHKADTLGIITRQGTTLIYTNKTTGQQQRSRNLETLEKKIKASSGDWVALNTEVNAKIAAYEEAAAQMKKEEAEKKEAEKKAAEAAASTVVAAGMEVTPAPVNEQAPTPPEGTDPATIELLNKLNEST